MANDAALRANTPVRLSACNATPPSTGPAIRVAVLVVESRLIAVARTMQDSA